MTQRNMLKAIFLALVSIWCVEWGAFYVSLPLMIWAILVFVFAYDKDKNG